MIRLDDDAVAIIHVNDPKPVDKDIKCKADAVCESYYESWLILNEEKYTYCCSLRDFSKAFNILSTDIGSKLFSFFV